MTEPKTYTTAGAFRRALEERLKKTSQTEQTDINRLRRQVSFDRLLARLFHDGSVPWVLKGGYALEVRFKMARSTVDIDLTMGRVDDAPDGSEVNQVVREMLQAAASLPLGDWFEFTIGSPMMDITAAPYGGARYPVEVRMDGRNIRTTPFKVRSAWSCLHLDWPRLHKDRASIAIGIGTTMTKKSLRHRQVCTSRRRAFDRADSIGFCRRGLRHCSISGRSRSRRSMTLSSQNFRLRKSSGSFFRYKDFRCPLGHLAGDIGPRSDFRKAG